jgi:hypothetical protein
MVLRAARTRALVAALFTTAIVGVAPASAQSPAERFPAGGPDMARAMQIATDYWQQQPCGGDVALRWASLSTGTRAEASWLNYVDAWSAPASNFDCSITFNTAMPFEWPDFCTTVVHEVGHLLGHQHTDDDDHVMHEHAVEPLAVCGGTVRSASSEPAVAHQSSVRTLSRNARVQRCVRRAVRKGAKPAAARRGCRRAVAQALR